MLLTDNRSQANFELENKIINRKIPKWLHGQSRDDFSLLLCSDLLRISMDPRGEPEGDDIYCDVSMTMHKHLPIQRRVFFNFNQEKIIKINNKGGIVMNNIFESLYEVTKVRLSSLWCKIILNKEFGFSRSCMYIMLSFFLFCVRFFF